MLCIKVLHRILPNYVLPIPGLVANVKISRKVPINICPYQPRKSGKGRYIRSSIRSSNLANNGLERLIKEYLEKFKKQEEVGGITEAALLLLFLLGLAGLAP